MAAAKITRNGEDVTANYNITYVDGELSVTQNQALVITAGTTDKEYDGTALTYDSYQAEGLAAGDRVESVDVNGSLTLAGTVDNIPSNARIVNAADEDVTASYAVTYRNGTLTVNPKPLTISASDGNKVYDGTALTKNTYTSGTLVTGDSITEISVAGSQTDAGSSANAASGARIRNAAGEDVTESYAISYVDGLLEVTQKQLTVTAGSISKVYDGTALTLDSYTGADQLAAGDSFSSVTVDGSRTLFGTSPNVPSDAKIVNADGREVTGNYDITYVNGTLEVTKRAVTVTAVSDSGIYDGKPLTNSNATTTELVTGDRLESVVVTGSQTDAGSSANVPSEAVFFNAENVDVTESYAITYANGTLTIREKSLTITANGGTREYNGKPLTVGTYTNTDLAEGDSIRDVMITGSQTVVGESNNVPSNASIVNSAGRDVTANYAIGYSSGVLKVTPKALTITADGNGKTYDGTPLTVNTYTSNGLAEGDYIYSISVEGSQTVAGSSDNVPSEAVVFNAENNAVTGSYTITYVNGTLTVTPKTMTITAADGEKVYDGTELTSSGYAGSDLAQGDVVASADVTGSRILVGNSGNVPSNGRIVNAAGVDVTSSYTIIYKNGTLRVTPRALTVTAASETREYNAQPLTNINYSSEGLAAGDTVSSASVSGTRTTVGTADNVAGSAHVVNSAGEDVTGCYTFTYEKGTLEVTPKTITVTADSTSKVYDGIALSLNSYSGHEQLAEGDSFSSVSVEGSQLEVGKSDNVASAARIISSTGENVTGSYIDNYVNGELEVTPREVTITAGSEAKTYDGTPLTKNSFTNTMLATGDRIVSVTVEGTRTTAGTAENVPSDARIINAAGADVTASYNITYVNGTLTVNRKEITITADSGVQVYDGTELTKNSYTSSPLASGDSIASVTVSGGQINAGSSNNVPSAAGIINSNSEDVTGSYDITYVNGTLEVLQKKLTITADSEEKTYDGTELTKATYTNSDLAVGDTILSVTVTGSRIQAGTSANVPSNAAIRNAAGANVTGNYDIEYQNGNLVVAQKPLTITAGSTSKTYDGTELTDDDYSSTVLAAGDSISSVAVAGSRLYVGKSDNTASNALIRNGRNENVTASYDITYVKGVLEVTPKPLTITADSAAKIYDAKPLTKDSYTPTELAPGDSIAYVKITGSQTTVGHSFNEASDARIINSDGEDVTESYSITYGKGVLLVTINQSLVITAESDTKVYDGEPLVNDHYSSTPLMGTDVLASVVVRGSQTNAGSMPNIPSAAVILNEHGEDVTDSYEIEYVPGMLTVEPKSLTIIAGSNSKMYDGTDLVEDSFTGSDPASGDRIESVLVTGAQKNAGSSLNTASEAVIRNAGGEDVTGNYNISYVDGELTVTKKPLTITANGGTKPYDGTELTADGYTPTGLAEGDKVSELTVTGSQINAGSSDNVPSGAVITNTDNEDVTDNYEITYEPGELTVTRLPLLITANSDEQVYNGTALTNSGSTSGDLAEGDRIDSVVVTGTRTNVGSSANTASEARIVNRKGQDVTDNYEIRYIDGTLKVTPKPLTIYADNAEKVYDGTALTSVSYTSGAIVNGSFNSNPLAAGDSIASVTMTGSQTEAGSSENVPSDAAIVDANGTDVTGNYAITYVEGMMTVTKRPVTITAGSGEKVYDGEPLTNDSYTASGEDADSGLANNHRFANVDVTGERVNVGTSPNVPSNASIVAADGTDVTANYEIKYVDGSLKVTPKTVYVTAEDKTKEFGQLDEELTAVVQGNLNNDPIVYTLTREEGEEPGSYVITPSGDEEQGNYTVVYNPGTLLITYNPATSTVRKVWVDDNNRDGIRPVSLTVTLVGSDGSSYIYHLSDSNNWTVTAEDLPLYSNGTAIEYSWVEEDVDGYTLESDVNGTETVLVNTHEIQRTSVSVNKVWADNDNAAGARPASLSVRLQSNGVSIMGATLTDQNGWTVKVNNLPLYENGSPIVYSWSEQSISGYYPVDAVVSGNHTTLTNSNLYTLTIHYRYSNGNIAYEDYVATQPAGINFSVTSPVITGYVADNRTVVGTQTAGNMEFTVTYTSDGSAVAATPTPVPTAVPGEDQSKTLRPFEEPEEQKDVPEPRVIEPDEVHTIVVPQPINLIDIEDSETALGLGDVFINNGGYSLE